MRGILARTVALMMGVGKGEPQQRAGEGRSVEIPGELEEINL